MTDKESMDCCPPGSLPKRSAVLAGATTPLKGETTSLPGGRAIYVARPSSNRLDGAVIVFHDIFGFDSARTHHICDELAEKGNFLVVAPDFFGESYINDRQELASFSFFQKAYHLFFKRAMRGFSDVEKQLTEEVVPYIKKITDKKIGTLGFCWGGWALTRYAASELNESCCGVGAHCPSFSAYAILFRWYEHA